MKPLVIGSRGSPLALAQVALIKSLLPGVPVATVIIKTSGDKFLDVSLAAAGGKGLFTKEIEDQLLAGTIHLAVHSLKDLPTDLPAGLMLAAVPAREDARDVFVSRRYGSLDELPPGARVATSSIRRKAQLLARRPDLQISEIRGNVATRLQKLTDFDGTLLAAAGLKRLGLWQNVPGYRWQLLDIETMIPAVGQGIIGCEIRADDTATRQILAGLNDGDAFACATAERTFLKTLGGGCQFPYAGHATAAGDRLKLVAGVFSPDGRQANRIEVTGSKAEAAALGEQAARTLRPAVAHFLPRDG